MLLILVSIGALLAFLIGLPFFMRWIAEENILFTTVREGTGKAIMRGKSCDRFVMSFKKFHLNDPSKDWYDAGASDWEILPNDPAKSSDFYDDRPWLLKHLGLYWVGWPWANSVYVYGFVWNETRTNAEGKEVPFPRAESTDYIQVNDFVYAIITNRAETKKGELLPVDVLTLITVRIVNLYSALFNGEDWMQRITAAINRHARDFIGKHSYEELISMTNGGGAKDSTEFSAPVIRLNSELPDDDLGDSLGLKGRYGVEIRTADLQTLELSGDGKKEHEEAATLLFVAGKKAEAVRIEGRAEADVIAMKGAKEAESLETRLKVIRENGDAGKLLVQIDGIRESAQGKGSTVIWANDPFVALGGKLMQSGTKGAQE